MTVFVARQPIFDRGRRVFAYELLLRAGPTQLLSEGLAGAPSPDSADSLRLPGIEAVTRGKTALVNMTRDALGPGGTLPSRADREVHAVSEAADLQAEVVEACKKLKEAGCLLALDASIDPDEYPALAAIADVISVDIHNMPADQLQKLTWRSGLREARLLATNVGNDEEYQQARSSGCSYFQGDHFVRPVILSDEDVPGFKLHYLDILREVHRPELDLRQIEQILKMEMSLSYKFLRYINSAYFGFRDQIKSIRHATVLLGEREIRRWVSMSAMWIMGGDRPEELVTQATIRARFCELVAVPAELEDRSQELFLMGMWSMLDAIVGRPLPVLLKSIPMAGDVEAALLGEQNRLREIFDSIVAYERGDWPGLSRHAERLGVDEHEIPPLYLKAVDWGHDAFMIPRAA